MVTLLGACTLNDTDFKLTPQDIVGDWALADAPLLLKSNHLAASNLTSYIQFRQDHYAVFQAVPVEELIDVGAGPPITKWSLSSGSGRWFLTDGGTKDRHIWKVTLETETKGIQLSVRRKRGRLIIAYQPDPDRVEQVILHRSRGVN